MQDPRAHELALLRNEDVYRQILDAIPDLILVKGAHSRIVWANKAFRDYYGMSNEQLRERIDAPFNAPDHTQQYIADDLLVFSSGTPLDIPLEVVTRHDGVTNNFHTVKSALRDEQGQVRLTVGVSRNIGETLELREQVMRFREQLERDRLSAFAAQLPGVLFQLRSENEGFRFSYASPSVIDYYGVDAATVLHDPTALLRSTVDGPEVFRELGYGLRRARTENGIVAHVHRVRGQDGVVRTMEAFIRAQSEPDGSFTLYAYAHDISARQRVAEEREALIETLRLRNHEMEQFTYTISHDLKSPLVTIRSFVDGIADDVKAGRVDRALSDLARVRNAAEKMSRMLEELLELSRVGRVAQRVSRFTVAEVVADARELLNATLTSAAAVVDVDGGDLVLEGDRGRLTQVMQNLIENAVKYRGQKPPHVQVRASRDKADTIALDVVDNGLGIDAAHQQRVFGLFEKLDARSDGSGVGLALVKSIVELHRGRVWLTSPGRGSGTTVHIRLPAVASAPAVR